MLTVTIKEGQKLYIGDDIVVHLHPESVGSRQVKLSVDAPKDVTILREKLKARLDFDDSYNTQRN
ncbi:carbon storage regulator [Neptuniibacter sp. QD37_6]|uniref:carbon storage regulator n=1 Tax=Neptuniibacter sp. QD37_6 TaxID=3398210 RepID=UPI0039F5E3E1